MRAKSSSFCSGLIGRRHGVFGCIRRGDDDLGTLQRLFEAVDHQFRDVRDHRVEVLLVRAEQARQLDVLVEDAESSTPCR